MGTAALTFDMFVEAMEGDDSWIEDTIQRAKKTFDLEKAPAASANCEYCKYRKAVEEILTS